VVLKQQHIQDLYEGGANWRFGAVPPSGCRSITMLADLEAEALLYSPWPF